MKVTQQWQEQHTYITLLEDNQNLFLKHVKWKNKYISSRKWSLKWSDKNKESLLSNGLLE